MLEKSYFAAPATQADAVVVESETGSVVAIDVDSARRFSAVKFQTEVAQVLAEISSIMQVKTDVEIYLIFAISII
jgi:hypothetical protein